MLYRGPVQFLASALEIYSEKSFLYFSRKYFLYFSLKKFLIFFHKETVLTFSWNSFPYISGNGKKYFLKKVFLIIWEMELSSPMNKNFRRKLSKLENLKKNLLRKNFWHFGKCNFLASSFKSSCNFSERSFSYISEKNLQSMKKKNF